jgi:hypothetical protein
MGPHDIGWAVQGMKDGGRFARKGWDGKNMWIAMHTPQPDDAMSLPFVFMNTVQGDMIPWLCSQADLLAEDWEEVE